MTVRLVTPHSNYKPPLKIFLAGSIDNGQAEDWQSEVYQTIQKYYEDHKRDIIILNPRNDDWDASIDPSSNDPMLVSQITWEQRQLETADLVLMYFAEDSKAPISLLEFGMFSKSAKMLVYCPRRFYRSCNVRVTATETNCPVFDDYDEWINCVFEVIDHLL